MYFTVFPSIVRTVSCLPATMHLHHWIQVRRLFVIEMAKLGFRQLAQALPQHSLANIFGLVHRRALVHLHSLKVVQVPGPECDHILSLLLVLWLCQLAQMNAMPFWSMNSGADFVALWRLHLDYLGASCRLFCHGRCISFPAACDFKLPKAKCSQKKRK